MKVFPALLVIVLAGARMAGQEAQSSQACWNSLSQEANSLKGQLQPQALSQALSFLQQALACDPAFLPATRKIEILLDLGNVQLRLGNNQEALDEISSALGLLKQIDKPGHDLLERQAAGLRDRGLALRRLQRIDDALASYGDARGLFHALGDRSGEARILSEIGLMTVLMGEHQKSLDYYRQALELSRDDPKRKAVVLDFIGRAYSEMNELDLAQPYFRDALTLCRKTQYHKFIAYTLNDLGALFVKQDKFRIAERFHKEALVELEKYVPDDGEGGLAETQAYLADAQSASGEYGAAIQNYQHALSFQEQAGDVVGEAQTRVSLGRAAMNLQDRDLALQSFLKASELYREVHNRGGESTSRFLAAKIFQLQGDYDRAQDQVESAITLAEEVRALTPGIHLRTAYFASLETMYRLKIELLLRQDPVPELQREMAFDVLQRAQSRALVDALAARIVPEDLSCGSGLASQRNGLLAELKKHNQRMQLFIRDRLAKSVIEDLFISIRRLEVALEEVEADCSEAQPRTEMLLAGAISLSEVREQILDQQSALLQFYLAAPHSYLWVVTRSATQLIRLPSKAWLEHQVDRVVKFGPAGDWTANQETALVSLCQKLLPALILPGIRKWIVVPDGTFHSLPFTLLAGKAGPRIEVIKIPSASAIRAIRKVNEATHFHQLQLALFADPVFDAQDSRVTRLVHGSTAEARRGSTRGSYARLLFSQHEARVISRLVPRDQVLFLRDFDATRDAVIAADLNRFRMVHFATHSIVDERHPDLSGILFSLVDRNGRRIPGYLLLNDIYRMKLRADLVVLSSCVSALGRQQAGEGPISLARGFLYAGSRAVVASLWEADDEATAEFMGAFYRHMLKDNLAPSEALSRTQAEFRHHPSRKLRNPYYWAGFELYGDWQAR